MFGFFLFSFGLIWFYQSKVTTFPLSHFEISLCGFVVTSLGTHSWISSSFDATLHLQKVILMMSELTPQTAWFIHQQRLLPGGHCCTSRPVSLPSTSLYYPVVNVNLSYVLPDSDVQLRERGLPAYLRGDRSRAQVFVPHEVCPAQRWKDLCRWVISCWYSYPGHQIITPEWENVNSGMNSASNIQFPVNLITFWNELCCD